MLLNQSPLELLQSRTLPGLVQEEIVALVKLGRLQAGARLPEASLAAQLNVSRPTLREAFRALEESGLVQLRKNRGAFIREISEAEALELYEVRAGLDELAGRLLALRLTEQQVAELRRLQEQQERIVRRRAVDEYFGVNIAFHDRVVEMTGNATLHRLYRRVIDQMHLLRRHSLSDSKGLRISVAEHAAIVEALVRRDPEAAASSMRRHVMSGHERMFTARSRAAGMITKGEQ
ncbi:MAG: FCD domain-containing protein [Acidisphaera sp.]|nr:FCD domain-containing protein [Acidisphaera sp.]